VYLSTMRSFAPSVLLSLLSLSLLSAAAPTFRRTSISAPDRLANALAAQKLNSEFQQLTSTDPCSDGEIACVEGARATCVNGSWELEQCPVDPQNPQCFALPSVLHEGTILACIPEPLAVALIEGSGATGGVTGTGSQATETAGTTDPVATETAGTTDPVATETAGTIDPAAPATVTVTVTLSDFATQPTVSLSPVTETVDPSEARTALGAPTQGAATITLNDPAAATATAAPGLIGNLGGASEPDATTIILTTTPVGPTETVAGTAAAAAVPPAATTPAVDPGAGYGGY
jgi:hypothetical protein